MNNECDIFAITETHLNKSISNNELNINGFNLERKDRTGPGRRKGGVSIYVNSKINYKLRTDKILEESLLIEITFPNIAPFLFGVAYRPRSATASFTEKILNTLEEITNEGKEFIFCGDMNIDLNILRSTKRDSVTKYEKAKVNSSLEDMNNLGLKQIIKEPTRIAPDRTIPGSGVLLKGRKSTLDHIYTNKPQNISYSSVPKISASDHFPVCAVKITS